MDILNLEGIELEKDKLWLGSYVLGKLLGGLERKTILDLGCGASFDCLEKSPNGSSYHPMFAEGFIEAGAIIYGLDKDFISLDEEYLKKFQDKTGVIPVAGWIEDVDKIFKNKQFDGIFSSMTIGHPTEDINWKEMLKRLYFLTKSGGYHYHYNHEAKHFQVSQNEIRDLGYNVLHYFEEEYQGGWGRSLLLKKPDK